MMSVLEYANELGVDVNVVLKKCKSLGINVNGKDDYLEEEDVIILDNELATMDNDSSEESESLLSSELEEKYELEDRVEEMLEGSTIKPFEGSTKQKLKKKNEQNKKEEYLTKKKAIYKNKEKLKSNKVEKTEDIVYSEGMSVQALADALNVNSGELVKKLVMMGMMISVNESIDFETAEILCLDYQKSVKRAENLDITNFENYEIEDSEEDLEGRAPVVTVMGHVDHGKTSLLDYIRNSHVVSGEAGGITQHIGAYQVNLDGQKITFIDTPGHAAFTEMRARGAEVTDIVIIIVAADDGVMPQTREAIDHAKAAKVPIIVAINKIDKPNINIDRIMSEMSECGLTPEEWGGDTIFCKISAHTGEGIDLLLENILALSEIMELKANPNRYASGTVLEARLDKSVGAIATVLIQNGTLRLGDPIVVGSTFGKIRTFKNDKGEDIVSALPSTPVEITGLSDVPVAGDKFMAFESEKEARSIAEKRATQEKEKKFVKQSISLEDLFDSIKEGRKEINIILKADVKGSEEAVKNALTKIDVEGVKINIIRTGVGAITESDVVLANASEAIIIGFNVVPNSSTKEVAANYNVEIRLYNIIYKVVEEIEAAMKGMLDPEYKEVVLGEAEVRKLYKFSKVGTIAGSHVVSGIIKAASLGRVIRDGVVIFEGNIGSLQREKDQAKEVKSGFDCGITIENFNDIKEGDIIQSYEMQEIKRV